MKLQKYKSIEDKINIFPKRNQKEEKRLQS